MKASELRIGNFYNQFGNETKISWVNLKELESAPDGQIWCKPIDLTNEWFLKFGFHKWGRDDMPRTVSYEKGGFSVFPANSFCDFKGYGMFHFKPKPNESAESAKVKIQYVHQLQNLYFALTGEELTITD